MSALYSPCQVWVNFKIFPSFSFIWLSPVKSFSSAKNKHLAIDKDITVIDDISIFKRAFLNFERLCPVIFQCKKYKLTLAIYVVDKGCCFFDICFFWGGYAAARWFFFCFEFLAHLYYRQKDLIFYYYYNTFIIAIKVQVVIWRKEIKWKRQPLHKCHIMCTIMWLVYILKFSHIAFLLHFVWFSITPGSVPLQRVV